METQVTPFILYALPRSRTYWSSRFLTYGAWTCEHDLSVRLRGLDDVKSALTTPFTGAAETAAAPYWRLLHKLQPALRTVVVRRPVEDVVQSLLHNCGAAFDEADLRRRMVRLDAKLDQVEARVPGVLSLPYAALDTEAGCKAMFEHCLQRPFDAEWWRVSAAAHMTVNFPAQVRYCQANAPQIQRLAAQAAQRIRTDLTLSKRLNADSMTYAEEPLEVWLRDARALIGQHHVLIGKPADEIDRMNLDLWRTLAANGVLHITTARSNGRVFGYLMTVTAPSMESPDKIEMHTAAFYADPSAPGVGAKLQRSAIQSARERGAHVVYSRAGHRGSGQRIGSLYKRLGAEHFGDLYALELT